MGLKTANLIGVMMGLAASVGKTHRPGRHKKQRPQLTAAEHKDRERARRRRKLARKSQQRNRKG